VRVLVQVGGPQADGDSSDLGGALALFRRAAAPSAAERLGDDARHGLARVERTVRVLEHHLEVAPRLAQFGPRQRVQVAAEQLHAAGGGLVERHHQPREVDLPEPDSPTMPRLRPASMVKLTPLSALHGRRRPEQLLARQRVVRAPGLDLEQVRRGHACARLLGGGHRVQPDAAHLLAVRQPRGRRPGDVAGGMVKRAAARERATGRQVDQFGHAAADGGQPAAARCAQARAGGEQALRVGVHPVGEHGLASGRSRPPAAVHHQHLRARSARSRRGRARSGSAPCRARPPGRWIRSRICFWMVTSSAVVGSSAISRSGRRPAPSRCRRAGAGRRRTGADRRRAARRIGDADAVEQRQASLRACAAPTARGAAAAARRPGGDGVHRVQRRHRLLEHHADAVAAQLRTWLARRRPTSSWPSKRMLPVTCASRAAGPSAPSR
jgi:hypothetical protein